MERQYFSSQIEKHFETHPVVTILGPRQCDKTTAIGLVSGDLATAAGYGFIMLNSNSKYGMQHPIFTMNPAVDHCM